MHEDHHRISSSYLSDNEGGGDLLRYSSGDSGWGLNLSCRSQYIIHLWPRSPASSYLTIRDLSHNLSTGSSESAEEDNGTAHVVLLLLDEM